MQAHVDPRCYASLRDDPSVVDESPVFMHRTGRHDFTEQVIRNPVRCCFEAADNPTANQRTPLVELPSE